MTSWLQRLSSSPISYCLVDRASYRPAILVALVQFGLLAALLGRDFLSAVEASTTVIDVLSQSANFSQVVTALQLARLIPYINTLSNCTLFAPTDDAFALRHDMRLLMMQAHKGREQARRELRDKLLYHLIPGDRWDQRHLLHQASSPSTTLTRMDVPGGGHGLDNGGDDMTVRVLNSAFLNGTWMNGTGVAMRIEMSVPANASALAVQQDDDNGNGDRDEVLPLMRIRVADSANVLRPDLFATRGVVHEMDNLLMPPPDIGTLLLRMAGTDQARQALAQIAMEQQLSGPGPWTLFLPEDQPFRDMHWVERRYLAHERGNNDLSTLLNYHIHQGQVYASELDDSAHGQQVETLQGESVQIARSAGQTSVNGVPLKRVDIVGSNGVVHVLPSILQPKAFFMNSFKYLIGLDALQFVDDLAATGMDSLTNNTRKPYTFLAVADSDLAGTARTSFHGDELARHLQYQIVAGSLVHRNQSGNNYQLARSILADSETNGVHQPVRVQLDTEGQATHINDIEVAIGPVTIGEHTIYILRAPLAAPAPVVEFLNSSKDGTTFLSALSDTGQLPQVQSHKGVTLFVPTQAAFDSLGLVYDAMRLPDAAEKLRRVIKATIAIDGMLYSDMIGADRPYKIPTLDGGSITLERGKDPYKPARERLFLRGDSSIGAGNATIVAPDLPIRNGVVHRIDSIVVPSGIRFTLRDLFRAAGGNTFLKAIDRLGLSSLIDAHEPLAGHGYTFFVPSDEAFMQFNDTLLFNDDMRMRRIILGHIVANRIIGDRDGSTGLEFATLLKDRSIFLEFERNNGRLRVGMRRHGSDDGQLGEDRTATIERSGNIPMGVVHRIDVVLLDGRIAGWSWWIVLLTVTGTGGMLGGGGFYGYQAWMKRRRAAAGYEPVP